MMFMSVIAIVLSVCGVVSVACVIVGAKSEKVIKKGVPWGHLFIIEKLKVGLVFFD